MRKHCVVWWFNAIYLVSGDEDLLELGQIGDCKIMTYAQFKAEWN